NPFAQALSEAADAGLLTQGEAAALAADEQLAALGEALLTAIVAPSVGGDDGGEGEGKGEGGTDEAMLLDQYLTGLLEALERLRNPDGGGGDATEPAAL